MTISISISGHVDDADTEARIVEAAKDLVSTLREAGQVYSASAGTSHHGTVQLNTGFSDSQEAATDGAPNDGTGHFRDVPEADRS